MILQRWQTVYLLVAVAAMIVFLLNPIACIHLDKMVMQFDATHIQAIKSGPDAAPTCLCTIWLAISGWIATGLAAVSVFTYRKLKLQKILALVSGLICVAVGFSALYMALFFYADGYAVWHWTAFLPFVSAILCWIAFFCIRRDQVIIESADRLWS